MADIIVAGNTSGAITISAPLVAGSGVLTLPTGTDTLVGKATTDTLTNKSIAATQLTGTIAAAALPAGSVLQVKQTTYATNITVTSTTFVSTGLSLAITPISTSSKILIQVYCPITMGSSSAITSSMRINKNSGTILMTDSFLDNITAIVDITYPITMIYLDSPATTSSTTYTIEFNQVSVSGGFRSPTVNYASATVAHLSTLTLMEIAG